MIELTSAAITRLNFKAEETNETHFRIGVTGGGCTGYEYIFDYCDDIRSDDWTIVVDDIRIVVDAISMPYLEGLTLDFVQKGLNEEFVFNNPNQTQSCGCGKSIGF
jgi:iron-sulfur cluster assembly protein